jgi:hypothetical protein
VARHHLLATASAQAAEGELRGEPKRRWERIKDELRAVGCHAGGYRLLDGDGTWSLYCSRVIYGHWRVVTAYAAGEVVVVGIGQHDGPALYTELASELGTSAVGVRREDKPGCCGPDGWPTVGVTRRSRRRGPAASS